MSRRQKTPRRRPSERSRVKRHPAKRRSDIQTTSKAIAATPVTAAELRVLRRELEQRLAPKPARASATRRRSAAKSAASVPMRWNPNPEDVQKSVAQLVLTIVEFLRQLMERQAIRRMEQQTLSKQEVEAVGAALMQLEKTIRDIGRRFGLTPEDLNIDLGSIKLM